MLEPTRGAIAFCSQGKKGLITSTQPEEVTYEDGTKGLAWTGYHIGPEKIGQPWSSRTPKVMQHTRPVQFLSIITLLRRVQRFKRIPEAA